MPASASLHADRGGRRTLLVLDAAKEQQHRVATELEEIGVLGVCRGDQLGERRVEDERDLLGTLSTAPGQLLGQLREARDVGEHERALERASPRPRLVAQPVRRDPWNEGSQRFGCSPGWAVVLTSRIYSPGDARFSSTVSRSTPAASSGV